jgi:hypothetical protein
MKKISKVSPESLDIHLPVFDKPMQAASVRSLDEINMWIEQDYNLFFNRSEYEKNKLKCSVHKQFCI